MPTQREIDNLLTADGIVAGDVQSIGLNSQQAAIDKLKSDIISLQTAANALTPVSNKLEVYDTPLNKPSQGLIGSTTAQHLYTPVYPWKNKIGDYTGKDGPQGTVPYGYSDKLLAGWSGLVTIPIIGLPSDCNQLLIKAKTISGSAPTIRFNAINSGVPPTLDGVAATVDVELNTTVTGEIGGNALISVRPGTSNAFIKFPQVHDGVLSLMVVNVYDAPGILEVYDGTVRMGVPPTGSFTLVGDSRVFFETQAFENVDRYIHDLLFGDPANSFNVDTYNQRNVVVDETGNKVLQITFDPRANAAANTSILFPAQQEAMEAAVEFDIRWMPDMEFGMTQGFKCAFGWSSATKSDDAGFAARVGIKPGRTGTLLAGNGGAKTHGDDGHSLRFDAFAPVTPSTHPLYRHVVPMQYAYWPEQFDTYGDPWPWNLCQYSPVLGQWYTIAHHVRCNTLNPDGSFNRDAFLYGYINRQLALKQEGFYLRKTSSPIIATPGTPGVAPYYGVDSQLKIGRCWFNVYHGGAAKPLQRCSLQIRNVRVAQFA